MDLDPKRAYFLVFVDRKPRFCVHIDSLNLVILYAQGNLRPQLVYI